jgi:hypothetical protein
MSIFQPFFDLFLLFQYGPAASCIDCFIIQQTFYIIHCCTSDNFIYFPQNNKLEFINKICNNWNSICGIIILQTDLITVSR